MARFPRARQGANRLLRSVTLPQPDCRPSRKGGSTVLNVVLLLVMPSIGMGVVMCLGIRWLRPSVRHDRRRFAYRWHAGGTKS